MDTAHVDECFTILWLCWPAKKAKKYAKKCFTTLTKSHTNDEREQFTAMLLNDIEQRIMTRQFGFNRMCFSTYLNGERWMDDHDRPEQSNDADITITNAVQQFIQS